MWEKSRRGLRRERRSGLRPGSLERPLLTKLSLRLSRCGSHRAPTHDPPRSSNLLSRAEGDAARFSALYSEYRKAPEVTRKRIYLETMGKVLNQAGKKMVMGEDLEGVLPLLNLEGQVRKAGGE